MFSERRRDVSRFHAIADRKNWLVVFFAIDDTGCPFSEFLNILVFDIEAIDDGMLSKFSRQVPT